MVAKLQSAFDSPDNSPNYLLMIELFLERREHVDSGMYILDNPDMSNLAALIYTASTNGAANDEIMTSLDYMLKRTGVKRASIYPAHLINTLRLHDCSINNEALKIDEKLYELIQERFQLSHNPYTSLREKLWLAFDRMDAKASVPYRFPETAVTTSKRIQGRVYGILFGSNDRESGPG